MDDFSFDDLDLDALASLEVEDLLKLNLSEEQLLVLSAWATNLATSEQWVPTSKQALAERVADEAFFTLYGGAAGGGKSEWLLMRAWRLSMEKPGHRTILFRRTYPELLDSLIATSLEKYDHSKARYKVGTHTWEFTNGSVIRFAHLQDEQDVYKYQSSQWEMIGFDEGTHFLPKQIRYMISRCRTSQARKLKGYRPHMVMGSNPGGVSHDWVKETFIDPSPPNTVFTGKRGQTYAFVPAFLRDNPYLDDEYAERLEELDEVERRQLLDGDWDAFEGRFLPSFKKDVHVIEPFDVPAWWPRERGLDWGFADPFAVVWGAWHDDTLYIYRETYERELTNAEQVAVLRAQTTPGEQIRTTYADPSIWARNNGYGIPTAAQYGRLGLPCVMALNARVSGWAALRDRLRVTYDAEGQAHTKIHIFSTCTNLIRTLASLPRSHRNPEDCDTDAEDHLPDALRYLVMTHGKKGRRPNDGESEVDRLHRIVDKNRRQRQRAGWN